MNCSSVFALSENLKKKVGQTYHSIVGKNSGINLDKLQTRDSEFRIFLALCPCCNAAAQSADNQN
jgi:hypothetical protein